MTDQRTVVITGAFSYTGRYATHLLLDGGWNVRTLTNHPDRANPFGERVAVHAYDFDSPEKLVESLSGASVLINTYWIRFPYGGMTFEKAVANTRTLIAAAKDAGVERIVHVSIANPLLDSPLAYYRGKAELEEAVKLSGLDYAILRPTVIFGAEDILINNIAWFVRHFPFFGIPGDGRYRLQPIFVEDMARLLVNAAERDASHGSYTLDAVGPETFTFAELVQKIGEATNHPARLIHLPRSLAYLATKVTGWFVGDVILTWEEYLGLMDDLLAVDSNPPGTVDTTRLTDWLRENAATVGTRYASELARHFR